MNNNSMSTPPSGPNSTTPNAGRPAPVRRRKPAASAFVEKKRPVARKPVAAQRPAQSTPAASGASATQLPLGQPAPQAANQPPADAPAQEPAKKPWTEYGVYISKKDIEEGMRYHGFKFNVRAGPDAKIPIIDPYDASQFTRPVRLHRRYARDKQETGEPTDAAPGIDDKERELHNARRAERQAEREANQALIAPTGTTTKKQQGKKKNQKVVEDVYYNENNPKQQKAAQLRYEETKPWHLEDFENKNTWIGTYQEPMSSSSVLLTVDAEHAAFTMTPIERWYKFTQTNRLDTMTAEEAEKFMTAGYKPDRWFLKTQVGREEEKQKQVKMKREQAMAVKKAEAAEDNGYVEVKNEGEFYNADKDDLDFEFNDEFQDDDEGAMFGNLEDEDAKEIEKRIREEMRGANISAPGLKDTDMDYDEEEERLKEEERQRKKREKRMKKQLIRKERKLEYEDDSDSNPYSESSEDEDSDEERERLEAESKEEEERKAAVANGDKSGASTKGTNTPSGRAEKKDPSRSNASLGASLKRPGSPNLSDASGTESRKKAKGTNGRALASNGRALSRKYRSQYPLTYNTDTDKLPTAEEAKSRGYGSGSDTDTSRARSSQQKALRLKHRPGSPRDGTPLGTPSASRAASPAPMALPTLEEVKAAIPEEGIKIGDLIKPFKKRVAGPENTTFFISLVKQAGIQDKVTKLIRPKRD